MKANVDFISSEKSNFDKDGQNIEFQRVTFIERIPGAVPLTITADKDLDFESVPRYAQLDLDIQLSKNNNGYIRAKVTGYNECDTDGKVIYSQQAEPIDIEPAV